MRNKQEKEPIWADKLARKQKRMDYVDSYSTNKLLILVFTLFIYLYDLSFDLMIDFGLPQL